MPHNFISRAGMRTGKTWLLLALMIGLVLSTMLGAAAFAPLASAAPGDFDTSFGGTGKVTTDFVAGENGQCRRPSRVSAVGRQDRGCRQ